MIETERLQLASQEQEQEGENLLLHVMAGRVRRLDVPLAEKIAVLTDLWRARRQAREGEQERSTTAR